MNVDAATFGCPDLETSDELMYTMVVQGAHVMQFARALGDLTPAFYDVDRLGETGPAAPAAPPTFLMAADHFDPDFARRPHPGRPWHGSQHAVHSGSAGFHTEQHFTFHRPVRAGDRLTVSTRPGQTWQKLGRRAGTMTFTETLIDYRDGTDELVAQARWVQAAVERRPDPAPPAPAGSATPQAPRPAATPAPRPTTLAVGQTWTVPLIEEVTRTTIAMYAGASGDFDPLHCDDTIARKRGYPGVFAHGMLTMGMSARAVTDVVAHDRVRYFGGRITGQVWPGDALIANACVSEVRPDARGPVATIAIRTENQHGLTVFDGTASVLAEQG